MKKRFLVMSLLSSLILQGQQTAKPSAPPAAAPKSGIASATPKPASSTPAKPQAVSSPASGIDTVIQLVKGGMSEGMIVRTIRTAGKAYALTPQDMLKLTQAGVSENIIGVMMDPKAEPAPAATTATTPPPAAPATPVPPAAAADPAPAPVIAASTPATTNPAQTSAKRRLALTPFDYSAVKNWVTFWFGNDVNIGQGIRAMLTTRVAKLNSIRLLERQKVDSLLKEQDFGATGRSDQASRARIGKMLGADAILYGDIVIFGRDDVKKKQGIWSNVSKIGLGLDFGKLKKEEKAVVAINYRIVDAETGEILDTGEARGESKRESKDWAAFVGKSGTGAVGATSGMESSNFEETIIGEATMAACDKLAEELGKKIPTLPIKARVIDAMIASVQGYTVYLNSGSNDGVQVGDNFEVHLITGLIKDPDTKEVLDKQTVKVGNLNITQVREKIAIGNYAGQPLTSAQLSGNGYAARKAQ
jgi:curli biogenesis system outer membrane secretion channel CsgG